MAYQGIFDSVDYVDYFSPGTYDPNIGSGSGDTGGGGILGTVITAGGNILGRIFGPAPVVYSPGTGVNPATGLPNTILGVNTTTLLLGAAAIYLLTRKK